MLWMIKIVVCMHIIVDNVKSLTICLHIMLDNLVTIDDVDMLVTVDNL